jgi:hypothetical protein
MRRRTTNRSLVSLEGDELEAALDIVQKAESLAGLGNGENVCASETAEDDDARRYP